MLNTVDSNLFIRSFTPEADCPEPKAPNLAVGNYGPIG